MSYMKEYANDSIFGHMQQVKILVDFVTAEERLAFKERAEDNLIGLEQEEQLQEIACYTEL